MNNPEQEVSEATKASENPEHKNTDENQTSDNNEQENSSVPSSEKKVSNDSNEQETTRRLGMPQDIRYATEQSDREILMDKYNNYQVSDTNACSIRFITDHRQKRNMLGRNDEENSNLHSMMKTFHVNIHSGYQNPTKHSFKILGTEMNVRNCLIDIINQMFKHINRSETEDHNDNSQSQETEKPTNNQTPIEKSPPHPTSIFVTTINADASITEEEKTITPSTPNVDVEKPAVKDENTEQEDKKFMAVERKAEYTFTILITSQGQEVLKKNWTFFADSLQQRLNVTVANPFKLPKFGDKQWQNELSITGEVFENIIDAALQLIAFINDVLGVPRQAYKADEEQINGESNHHPRSKNNNDHQQQQQRRQEYKNGYHSSPSPHQGQSSPFNNNYQERTFFNRSRNGAFEQVLLIRSNCVARIVGTRGSNLKRIQSKCHLRDMVVARQPNENGYVECTISAYQPRNLNFAIDTIRSYLRNEDEQAIQVFDSYFIDIPSQSSPYQNSPQHDQPQLSVSNQNFDHFQQYTFPTHRYQQQPSMTFTAPTESPHPHRETGFMIRPLHLGNGNHLPPPSYNFQNTPSFDFTHRPTSASRKTDKRPGDMSDIHHTPNGHNRTSNDYHSQTYGGSSSSNSSSVSPRHKSKRTCPETKEVDCTTDEGFWIQKQFYHALDDSSKELFDSLLDKMEKIRITMDENAARKQQRLVGRNRANKSRVYTSSITHSNGEKDLSITSTQHDEETKPVEKSTAVEEEKETTLNEQETTTTTVEQT